MGQAKCVGDCSLEGLRNRSSHLQKGTFLGAGSEVVKAELLGLPHFTLRVLLSFWTPLMIPTRAPRQAHQTNPIGTKTGPRADDTASASIDTWSDLNGSTLQT